MWSSYQCSTDVRNRLMSPDAFLTKACSDGLKTDIESGSASTDRCTMLMVVTPAESGATRSITASAKDLAGM